MILGKYTKYIVLVSALTAYVKGATNQNEEKRRLRSGNRDLGYTAKVDRTLNPTFYPTLNPTLNPTVTDGKSEKSAIILFTFLSAYF